MLYIYITYYIYISIYKYHIDIFQKLFIQKNFILYTHIFYKLHNKNIIIFIYYFYMILNLFLGGPGSGKVTHCDNLMQEKKGITHINMMDLLQQYALGNGIFI